MQYYSGTDYLFWLMAAIMMLGPLSMAPAYSDHAPATPPRISAPSSSR